MDKQTIYDTVMKYEKKEDVAQHAIDMTASFVYADVMSLVNNVINLKLRSTKDVTTEWNKIKERWDGTKIIKSVEVKQ